MNTHFRLGFLIYVAASAPSSLAAQEKPIARSALPPRVEQAVTAQSIGASIRGFSEEREHGQTYYEAQMVLAGRTKDVLFDTSGAVVEVEEQVALESLPPSVRNALTERAKTGTITKVESLVKQGRLVAFEAQVTTKGQASEVQVGPAGERLDHEE